MLCTGKLCLSKDMHFCSKHFGELVRVELFELSVSKHSSNPSEFFSNSADAAFSSARVRAETTSGGAWEVLKCCPEGEVPQRGQCASGHPVRQVESTEELISCLMV